MRLLLDTMVLIWSITNPDRIPSHVFDLMRRDEVELNVSALSLSEIAIKASIGKLNLARAETEGGIKSLQAKILPFTRLHAMRMFDLPLHHKDPFDRQIIAQVLEESIPLVTVDPKFQLYAGVEVIW